MDRQARRDLIDRMRCDAQRIASRFNLRYRAIEAERTNVKSRYGICYSDGTIRIRLNHAKTGKALKYSSLVSTLCHELAHLRHFDHGLRFQSFYREILEYARDTNIYEPGTADHKACPEDSYSQQLHLFSESEPKSRYSR